MSGARQRWQPDSGAALTTSSTISLVADTAKMNNNGTSVVYRPVGETSGICWPGRRT